MMDEQEMYQELYGCVSCHQAPVDRSENPNSRLCRRCREAAIHYPIPKISIPVVLVILVLTAFAYIRMPESLTDYRIYATAEAQIEAGMLYDTLYSLDEVASRHPDFTDLAVRLVTLSMEYGCYDYAAYSMNTYLAGKSLSDVTYGEMVHYQNVLTSYYDTMDALQEVVDGFDEDMDPELTAAIFREHLEMMKEDPRMFQSVIWYYLAQVSESPEEYKECLLRCLEEDPMDFVARADLGTRLRRDGDLEGAKECYEQILCYEKTEALANRGIAILKMLEGDLEGGLEYARIAYESNPDAAYVRDTYLVALFENRMEEEAEAMKQEMEEADTPVEEDTKALLSGEITLREYYVEEETL